ncbi:MAG: RNA-binding protein [Candidatus Pacearchaeota archaeon]
MKVYVGNLPWSVDDGKLETMFSEFGDITEATVLKDKFSGRSKGFGFVTFANDDDAKKAISAMNDKDIEGRKLKVNEAKPFDPDAPRPPRRDFGDRGGDRGGSRGGGRSGGYGGGSGGRGRRDF